MIQIKSQFIQESSNLANLFFHLNKIWLNFFMDKQEYPNLFKYLTILSGVCSLSILPTEVITRRNPLEVAPRCFAPKTSWIL